MGLYARLGDEAAKSLVTELQDQLSLVVTECGGVLQDITGDEIMVRFAHADAAAQCAKQIHECARAFSQPSSRVPSRIPSLGRDSLETISTVQMRLGIHWGLAIVENDRMFGDTVNVASRVSSIARGGQTIATEMFIEQLSEAARESARQFDTTTVKGRKEPLTVFDLPWHQEAVTEINQLSGVSQHGWLELIYKGQTVKVGTEDAGFTIGRALTNDLVVDAHSVSRRHVLIERMRGRFVVSDQSTNGTHVYIEGGEDIYLRREQLPVWGEGRLSLGATAQGSGYASDSRESESVSAHVVHYRCVSG